MPRSSREVELKIWDSRAAKKNGCVPIVKRGTMPQMLRLIIAGMKEMNEDIRKDLEAMEKKYEKKV